MHTYTQSSEKWHRLLTQPAAQVYNAFEFCMSILIVHIKMLYPDMHSLLESWVLTINTNIPFVIEQTFLTFYDNNIFEDSRKVFM